MSDFVPNNRYLREVLIFFFHSKKTAAEAHRKLQKVYGDAALSDKTCRDWFRRFKDSDFDVDDRPREERPKTFEEADVIYYELLKPNETITGERYRTQLMRLSRGLREKLPQLFNFILFGMASGTNEVMQPTDSNAFTAILLGLI